MRTPDIRTNVDLDVNVGNVGVKVNVTVPKNSYTQCERINIQ
jgi:hypothetical protein